MLRSPIIASVTYTRCSRGTSIPVVDLLDTFAGTDVDSMRVVWYDQYPNVAGHRRIANELYRKLKEQPDAWAALTGQAVSSPQEDPQIQ